MDIPVYQIDTAGAVKSINKLLSLTDQAEAVGEHMEGVDPFEHVLPAVLAAIKSELPIRGDVVHYMADHKRVIEWQGTCTPDRRIQWVFYGDLPFLYCYLSFRTGTNSTESKFIGSVLEGIALEDGCTKTFDGWVND